MKTNLQTLMVTLVCIALVCGWMVDRVRLKRETSLTEEKLTRVTSGAQLATIASHTVQSSLLHSACDPEDYIALNRLSLVAAIQLLALNEQEVDEYLFEIQAGQMDGEQKSAERLAVQVLHELKCETLEDYLELYEMIPEPDDEILDAKTDKHVELANFVDRSLKHSSKYQVYRRENLNSFQAPLRSIRQLSSRITTR